MKGPLTSEQYAERFWSRVDKSSGQSECWPWTGAHSANGYSRVTTGYRTDGFGHRFAYELTVGPIPAGLEIDHLCRVRSCVNPAHLEAVTPRENVLRSPTAPTAINARKTECKRGHVFTEQNTYTSSKGCRACRACRRERDRAKYWRDRWSL